MTTIPPTTTTTTPPASTPPVSGKQVIVLNNGDYNPLNISITVGTTIEFHNIDHNDHTFASDYPFNTVIYEDGVFDFVFAKAGTFKYWDTALPGYKGTITVIN